MNFEQNGSCVQKNVITQLFQRLYYLISILDVIDKIRMKYTHVNEHIIRGHFSSNYSSMSSDSTGGSSSAASSLEKSSSTSLGVSTRPRNLK